MPSLLRASLSVRPTPAIGGWLNTARGDAVIIDAGRLAAEHRVGERLTLADRDRGELDAVGDVADRVDAVGRSSGCPRRPRIAPSLVQLDAGAFEPEPVRCWARDRWRTARSRRSIGSCPSCVTISAPSSRFSILSNGALKRKSMPLRQRDLEQPVADRLVIAAQDRVAAVDDGDVAAELVEDAGELIGDIAARRRSRRAWAAVEVEDLVRGDAVLVARERRAHAGARRSRSGSSRR